MSVDFDALRSKLAGAVSGRGLPSMAVAAARDGEIVFEDAFGWADRAEQRRATAHTSYSLASITKPITAAALMVLVERGKIDLDRPICDYLRGCRVNAWAGDADEVTVRRVANHTSGLPLHYHFFYEDEPYEPPPMSETMRRYANIVTPPGERYHYSNLGYGVLDHLIAVVSGMSYADFVRREVLLPLGMHRSSVDLDPTLRAHSATRYGADGVPYPFYGFDHPGGSAVFASAHDLLRFAMADMETLLPDQRAVLSPVSLTESHRPDATSITGYGYGIGWITSDDEAGYATRGHTGAMGGVSTAMAIVPSERIAVVALCNAHSTMAQWARLEMLSALLPDYATRQGDAMAALVRQAVPPSLPIPDDVQASLRGQWEGAVETFAGSVTITFDVRDEGEVRVRLASGLRTLLDNVRWDGSRLHGALRGDLGTGDGRGRPAHLLFDLALRDDAIDGSVTAMTDLSTEDSGAPERRAGNALSHWVHLVRSRDA